MSVGFVILAAKSDANPTLTPGLLSAFKFAEFMRRDLVSGVISV